MKPRIIYRTHYQVDEPAYVGLLVSLCTSPIESTYSERVAERLHKAVIAGERKFNIPAAGYALDLARSLGVVNENNVWTEKGHLLALHSSAVREKNTSLKFELTLSEKLTYFRLFLEADGAVIRYIAERALNEGGVPTYAPAEPSGPEIHDWNLFASSMFASIYGQYLEITKDIADRIAIRREFDHVKRGFTGKTGVHKSLIHLQTMLRLGLLERAESAVQREYVIREDAKPGLVAFLETVNSVSALEVIVREGTWAEVAAIVFRLNSSAALRIAAPRRLVSHFYRRVMETGVPLCSTSTLIDAVQVYLLSNGARLLTRKQMEQELTNLQKESPKDVRFHVDRSGKPAFIKISDQLVAQLGEGTVDACADARG
jgi:hypothetical protein